MPHFAGRCWHPAAHGIAPLPARGNRRAVGLGEVDSQLQPRQNVIGVSWYVTELKSLAVISIIGVAGLRYRVTAHKLESHAPRVRLDHGGVGGLARAGH